MKFISGKSKASMNMNQFNALLSHERKSSGSNERSNYHRGMFDLTPDSNNAQRYHKGLGNKSKSSKSGDSQYR